MGRSKKTRKLGAAGAPEFVFKRGLNRSESDEEGRLRKKLKKRKGHSAGSRHSQVTDERAKGQGQAKDPRLGSKKKIPLIVEPKAKVSAQQRKLNAEQELEMLENDPQLNVLLDRLEAGENLGVGLQRSVDEKLDRIEQLMSQLGLLDEDDVSESQTPKATGERSDEALLDDFDNFDINDLKG
ncbi:MULTISPECIES: Der GTPase-activating protein YihI [unclassified Vibrio]|uniref:Der GTPase-activating protein YihI n=1 Tax=Vibrio sp. HB236076 TaxID=3232307 RepID=A0AB39HEC8_9VIBR|nr:Der GTPase-activating protein YihI [Vibrio sp. HB161653]MDP5255198.1 Der GTPase-activating protein YihI [Vibrio sp. HB161653]